VSSIASRQEAGSRVPIEIGSSVRIGPATVLGEERSVDEKVLEEIRFHQDVVNKDASSPLYQIREKELEISGRVLAARNQAEKILSDARKAAQDTLRNAEANGDKAAKKHAEDVIAQAEVEAADVRAGVDNARSELRTELDQRVADAVEFVVSIVASA